MKARSSMEAFSVDVFKIAEDAGMPLRGPEGNEAYWIDLLFVD